MPVLISTRYRIPIPQFGDITYSEKKILHIIKRICGSVEITGFVFTSCPKDLFNLEVQIL